MEADTKHSNRTKVWSEGRGFAAYEVSFDSFPSSDVALGNVFSSGLSLWLYKQRQRLAFGGTKSDLNDSAWDFCQAAPPSVCCGGFSALPLAGGLVVFCFLVLVFFSSFHAKFFETLLWDSLFLLKKKKKKSFLLQMDSCSLLLLMLLLSARPVLSHPLPSPGGSFHGGLRGALSLTCV